MNKEALAKPEHEKERCVGCEACIDTACGRDECPKGWPKAAQPEQEPDDVTQWKALLENEYKQRKLLQWQLDRLMEQMLPINDDFIDDVLEDDDFEREKRMAFLQGVRWREAMYKIK